MASLQSANMTTPTTLPSGISNLPKVQPYPKFLDISSLKNLEHVLCYIQDHPGTEGFSLMIDRDVKNDDVFVLAGYWNGDTIDLESDKSAIANEARKFIGSKLISFVNLMRSVNIPRAQYYFSMRNEDVVLQDVRTEISRFVGPGFIQDVFSTLVAVPTIRMIEPLSSGNIDAISMNTGSYEGNIIIKPSRFRMLEEGVSDDIIPYYVEITR